MRAGDIIFVKGKGLLSDLIRHFDSGEFTHVAIAVSDTEIFEAQYYTRATIVPNHYEDYKIISLNLTDQEVEKLKVICQALTGKWYDYVQILGYLMRWLYNADVRMFNNPNYLICSEALGIILYLLDKVKEPLVNLTPNELYREVSKIG